MSGVTAVLLAVAKELAAKAKNSFPELRDGEQIQREWYENGVYYRETTLNGVTFLGQYDFRQQKYSREETERGERQSLT